MYSVSVDDKSQSSLQKRPILARALFGAAILGVFGILAVVLGYFVFFHPQTRVASLDQVLSSGRTSPRTPTAIVSRATQSVRTRDFVKTWWPAAAVAAVVVLVSVVLAVVLGTQGQSEQVLANNQNDSNEETVESESTGFWSVGMVVCSTIVGVVLLITIVTIGVKLKRSKELAVKDKEYHIPEYQKFAHPSSTAKPQSQSPTISVSKTPASQSLPTTNASLPTLFPYWTVNNDTVEGKLSFLRATNSS